MVKVRGPLRWSEEISFKKAYERAVREGEMLLCSINDGETIYPHKDGALRIIEKKDPKTESRSMFFIRINDEEPVHLPIWARPEDCFPFCDSWIIRRNRRFYVRKNMDVPYYTHKKGAVEKCIPMPNGHLLVIDDGRKRLIEIGSFGLLRRLSHKVIHKKPFDEVKLNKNVAIVRSGDNFFEAGARKPFWPSPEPWIAGTKWWPYLLDGRPAIAKYSEKNGFVVSAKRPDQILFDVDVHREPLRAKLTSANGYLIARSGDHFFCDGSKLPNPHVSTLCKKHFVGFMLFYEGEVTLLVMK